MKTAIYTGILAGLALSISVGPVVFEIIKYSMTRGIKGGISFVLGVNFSDLFYIGMMLIASSYMTELSQYEKHIGIVGSLIFICVGLYGLMRRMNMFQFRSTARIKTGGDYLKIWMSGFLLNTFNPGALVMWLALNVTVISYPMNERIAFFIAVLACVLVSDLLKVFLAGKLGKSLTPRNNYYLNRLSSLLLIVIGIILLFKSLGYLGGITSH